ncbi:MAG: RNA polymerase sigma factor [Odoribacter splanchnicus]|jgi:RNA polymerase sigma-70 factor (ECF subfamily)
MLTNSQGFKRFFELYFEPVYRFVRKYTEEDAIARDITQDTFIRLYERRRDFDVPEKQNLLSISQPGISVWIILNTRK